MATVKETKGKVFRAAQFEDPDIKGDKVAMSETDIENSAAKKDISVIDIEAIKKLLNSDNIIEDYNKYCDESAKRIAALSNDKSTQFMRVLRELNSEAALLKLIRDSGYQEFTNKEELIKYIQLKIDMYNSIINAYINMLEHNYKALKISEAECNKMVKKLKSGKEVGKTADKILDLLEKNKKLWSVSWGADFTKLGGGKVFMNLKENVWDISGNARSIYNMSTQWDVVILCHGTDITPGRSLTQEEKEFVEKYKNLARKANSNKLSKEDIKKFEDEFTEADKKILSKYKNIDKLLARYDINFNNYSSRYYSESGLKKGLYIKDRLLGELKKNWGFASPLTTPYGTFRDVNECLRACIEHGEKSIKIMACNPGHYEIAPDIRKMKDIKIDYQYYSVLMENSETVLDEAIDLKSIVDKTKSFLNDFKERSSKIFKSIFQNKFVDIKLPFISIKDNKAKIEDKQIKSGSELARAYESSNNSIMKEITNAQNSIKLLEEAKEILKSHTTMKANQESVNQLLIEANQLLDL